MKQVHRGSATSVVERVDVVFMLLACFLVLVLLRDQVGSFHKEWQRKVWSDETLLERPSRLSQATLIGTLSSGIKPLVADVYWTKAMTLKSDQAIEQMKNQASAGPKMSSIMTQTRISRTTADSRDLYDLVRLVTTLDPMFEYAYYYGSTLLVWDDQLELGLSLAEAGFRSNPKSAMLASNLAFINYYFMNDWEKGAYYAMISYKNSGKYAATPRYVADLYGAGRNYEMAIRFLADSLDTVKDARTREEIKNQIAQLMVEYHIQQLEKAAIRYKETFGSHPQRVEDIAKRGILASIPQEPFGGKYVVRKDGTITNKPEIRNKHYEQMRDFQAYKPRGGRRHL